jgi:hypothetical protein
MAKASARRNRVRVTLAATLPSDIDGDADGELAR